MTDDHESSGEMPVLGRIMALDYGTKRTGVAVSDPSASVARPLDAVANANSSDGLAILARMIRDLGIATVIVGLPVSLDGSQRAQAQRSRSFAQRLQGETAVPVQLYDERFTSRMADDTRRLSGSTTSRDSLAACHLLTSWLEAQH